MKWGLEEITLVLIILTLIAMLLCGCLTKLGFIIDLLKICAVIMGVWIVYELSQLKGGKKENE